MDKDSHLNLWNLCPSFESVYIKAKTFAKVDFFFPYSCGEDTDRFVPCFAPAWSLL